MEEVKLNFKSGVVLTYDGQKCTVVVGTDNTEKQHVRVRFSDGKDLLAMYCELFYDDGRPFKGL